MNLTESLQGVELPSDLSFIPWLAERGLTDLVVSVVDNLRPYFPESAFRLERVEDPETLNEVLVVVRPQAHVSADEIIASLIGSMMNGCSSRTPRCLRESVCSSHDL